MIDDRLDLLTVEEAAELLKITPYTIREMIKRGEIPAAKIGRFYRIKRSDLIALVSTMPPVGIAEQTK